MYKFSELFLMGGTLFLFLYALTKKNIFLMRINVTVLMLYVVLGVLLATSYAMPYNPVAMTLNWCAQYIQDQKPVVVVPVFLTLFVLTHIRPPRTWQRSGSPSAPAERSTLEAKYLPTSQVHESAVPTSVAEASAPSKGQNKAAAPPPQEKNKTATETVAIKTNTAADPPVLSVSSSDNLKPRRIQVRVHSVPGGPDDKTKYETIVIPPKNLPTLDVVDVYDLTTEPKKLSTKKLTSTSPKNQEVLPNTVIDK